MWRVLRRNREDNEDLQSPALLKEKEDFCDLIESGSNQMLVMGVRKLEIRSVYQSEGSWIVCFPLCQTFGAEFHLVLLVWQRMCISV